MKKFIATFLVILMVLSLVACATSNSTMATTAGTTKATTATTAPETTPETTKADKLVIAGIYKMGTIEWFLQEGEASRQVIEAAGGTFTYMDSENDGAKFMELIDTCIADKVDGVLVCIPDQNLSQACVTSLKEAGIPVIACDDALEDENGKLLAPWVGIDAYKIGSDVGEWAAQYIKDKNLADDPAFGVLLMSSDTVSSCAPRTVGQIEQLEKLLPGIDAKIFKADSDGNTETGNVAASAVITGNPQITKWLVLAVSDESAVGAARAIESAGLASNSMVCGLGGYYAPKEFANATSPFRAAAYFSAKGVGGTAAQSMLDFLKNGTPIPEKVAVSATIVEYGDDLASIMPEYMK